MVKNLPNQKLMFNANNHETLDNGMSPSLQNQNSHYMNTLFRTQLKLWLFILVMISGVGFNSLKAQCVIGQSPVDTALSGCEVVLFASAGSSTDVVSWQYQLS